MSNLTVNDVTIGKIVSIVYSANYVPDLGKEKSIIHI